MKTIKTILTCWLAIVLFSNSKAQVTASFTVDVDKGCSPLKVTFKNNSSGTGTLSYKWVFGNGNESTEKDPVAYYTKPGPVEASLTVSNGTQTSTSKVNITVFKNPVANFTVSPSSKGCAPMNVTFTDASTAGSASITKRNWDFRNGVVSSDLSPMVPYTSAGKYDVYLEVIDANGCKSIKDSIKLIDLVEKPSVNFVATPSTACIVPATIKFTNNSTGGGTLTYNWDFGDGKTSTQQSPSNTYNAFKTYNVKLTVNSSYGCSNTMDGTSIIIGEVNALGTLKQGSRTITNNGIVCAGELDFSSQTAGSTNILWDFGDNSTSETSSGKHFYYNAGNYKVRLIAAPGGTCADTMTWNITVEKATAAFNISPDKSCNASSTVSFSNQSSANSTSYKWKFHDASVVTTKDVVKTYTQPVDKDQYVIHEAFNYPVKLTVTTANGCQDSTEKDFIVHQPTALFTVSTAQGCAPLSVNFTDISQSTDPITKRTWKFGDGTESSNPSHTYNTPGIYEAKLIAETSEGCVDESYIVTIKVGNAVTPNFSINNSVLCSSQKIELTNLSPAGANRWHYSIGGKGVSVCPEVQNPSLFMKTDFGSLAVKLIVESNGCLSETEKLNEVKNDGPVGDFSYSTTCNLARAVAFKATALGATSFKWDFGDESSNTANLQLTHFYSAEGDYTVKFITFNGSCSDTVIRVVKVRDHQPKFNLKSEVCAGDVVYFNSQLSHTIHNSCTEKYLWNFGDNSQMIRTHKDSVSHSFANGGNFQVKLYAFYEDGCVDSISKPIRVYKPVTGFTANRTEGCSPLPVTFTDTSTPDVHPIIYWEWNFSDGNTANYTSKINTVSNTFVYPGEYLVTLNVTDDFGCKAKFEKKISTAVPTANFSAITSTQVCAGSEVQFLLDYPNPDSAIWNFGNGKIIRSIEKPTKFIYADSGSFDVSLKVYKFGCSEEAKYNSYIQVQKADARFTASDTIYNCYPRMDTLTHVGGSKTVLSGKWYYGHRDNSSSGYLEKTYYNYTEPGTYTASLEIQTTFGCLDTFSRQIKITGPTGHFAVTPKEACQGDEITYTLSNDTANVYSFEWDLGDGNLSKANPVKHRYTSVGNKTAKLILFGDKGKCIPPPIEETIHIYEVTAGINVADTSVCEGTTISFQNSSLGATTYNWNFGDGSTSTTQSPTHLFAPGTYKVTLATSGLHGCKDTTEQYIIVSKYPTLTVSNDTTICFGGNAFLKVVSDKPIQWVPSTYLSSPAISNPISNATESIKYIVFATEPVSQCFKKDSIEVTVQKRPVIDIETESGTFVAGRPIQIIVNTEEGATFKWTPTDFLSCSNCPDPISTARLNTSFNLEVKDKNNCFKIDTVVNISIKEGEKAFDVPSAFTPSGTEPNNIFKVQGYNVKQLLEFKIYNRWGNMVFSSTDVSKGWDGTYQGKPQPVDSYVYTIKVETFDGIIETKTGTILLLR